MRLLSEVGKSLIQYTSGTVPSFRVFREITLNPVIMLLPACYTFASLRKILSGLQRCYTTHNPLVVGSSPTGPTKQESRAMRGFCVSGRLVFWVRHAIDMRWRPQIVHTSKFSHRILVVYPRSTQPS